MRSRLLLALFSTGAAVSLLGLACNTLLGTPEPVLLGGSDGGEDASTDAPQVPPKDGGVDAFTAPDTGSIQVEASVVDATADAEAGAIDAALPCCGENPSGGSCPALLLGSPDEYHGMQAVFSLAASGGRVYGTGANADLALVYAGATVSYAPDPERVFPSVYSDAGVSAGVIVTDDHALYFSVYGGTTSWTSGIYALGLDGGAGSDAVPIVNADRVSWLAVDDSFLYWSDSQLNVWRANKDGLNPTAFNVNPSVGIKAKGGKVYYVSNDPSPMFVAVNPADWSDAGTYPATFSTDAPEIDGFDVGAKYIFWEDESLEKVYRTPLDSPGVVEDITPPQMTFYRAADVVITTDDTYVYLLSSYLSLQNPDPPGGTTIYRFLPNGTSLATVATLTDGSFALTQDATSIYFATYGNEAPGLKPFSVICKLEK